MQPALLEPPEPQVQPALVQPALPEPPAQMVPLAPQGLPDLTALPALRGLALPVLLVLPGLARQALLAPPERQALV